MWLHQVDTFFIFFFNYTLKIINMVSLSKNSIAKISKSLKKLLF